MKRRIATLILLCYVISSGWAATFAGVVFDEKGNTIEGAEVLMVGDDFTTTTNAEGAWILNTTSKEHKTLVFHKDGYTYEQLVQQKASKKLEIVLRKALISMASAREMGYTKHNCESIIIPDNPAWNVSFKQTPLKGDLAPNNTYSRRDPSAIIKVDGLYYMWYSYSLTFDTAKIAPWDLNDLYYATSKDGYTWDEKGIAVGRGKPGSFDARSVFTTEIFTEKGKYYLVYQAAADLDGIYNRNTVGMATADSPNGPWKKLKKPVLYPTYTNDLFFDNNAVHDPCIISYKNKYYLYYKGECNCRQNDGCVQWCNPICGYKKQVKWGVAISDSPTGPFVKSVSNPVTNTGHEVMVWPYADGVAILQHQDGPEANTIQYAKDGVNFEIKGKVTNIPEAAGLYRSNTHNSSQHDGIFWGVGHVLQWDAGPKGWMYIRRFDLVAPDGNTTSRK